MPYLSWRRITAGRLPLTLGRVRKAAIPLPNRTAEARMPVDFRRAIDDSELWILELYLSLFQISNATKLILSKGKVSSQV